MARGVRHLLSLSLVLAVLLSSVSATPSASSSSGHKRDEGIEQDTGHNPAEEEDDSLSASASMGGLSVRDVRSLPPSPRSGVPPSYPLSLLSPSSAQSSSSLFPFLSNHLLALRHLINSSAAGDRETADDGQGMMMSAVQMPAEVRDRILKYYFLSDLPNSAGQQQTPGSRMAFKMGTMSHAASPQSPSSSSPTFPLRESEIRRLLSRYPGHPIETLLRRALRASRGGQYFVPLSFPATQKARLMMPFRL